MITAYLHREPSTKYGTFGVLSVPGYGFSCFTAEPPWKNNRVRLSCIPPGEYTVRIRRSPKYGIVFHVTDVQGRTYILFHSGNYSGDMELGYRTDTLGCILLGKARGWLAGQRVILNSRITVNKFMRIMKNETFKLIIS